MKVGSAIARMAHYRASIARELEDACSALHQPEATRYKALALSRWHLLRVLREYQLFKHTEVFDPIISQGDDVRAQAGKLMKDRCLEIGAKYGEHVRRWSMEGAASDWVRYRDETLRVRDEIFRHLEQESVGVQLLLTDVLRTRAPYVADLRRGQI